MEPGKARVGSGVSGSSAVKRGAVEEALHRFPHLVKRRALFHENEGKVESLFQVVFPVSVYFPEDPLLTISGGRR